MAAVTSLFFVVRRVTLDAATICLLRRKPRINMSDRRSWCHWSRSSFEPPRRSAAPSRIGSAVACRVQCVGRTRSANSQ